MDSQGGIHGNVATTLRQLKEATDAHMTTPGAIDSYQANTGGISLQSGWPALINILRMPPWKGPESNEAPKSHLSILSNKSDWSARCSLNFVVIGSPGYFG